MLKRKKQYTLGFLSAGLQRVLSALLGFVTVPILLHYLGDEGYGAWVLVGNVIAYLGLMDFGLSGTVMVLVANHNAPDKEDQITPIINTIFFLQVAVGLGAVVVGLGITPVFTNSFEVTTYTESEVFYTFLYAVLAFSFGLPSRSFKGLIRGRQFIAQSVWIEFGYLSSAVLVQILFLTQGMGLFAMPLGLIVARVLSYPVYWVVAKKAYPALRLRLKNVDRAGVRQVFGYSALWFVGVFSDMIIASIDALLIGYNLGTEAVTPYTITFRLAFFLQGQIFVLGNIAVPGLGQLLTKGARERAKEVFVQMQRFVFVTGALLGMVIICFNEAFVDVWVGADLYLSDTATLLFVLYFLMSVYLHACMVVLRADLKFRVIGLTKGAEMLLNLGLSLWLITQFGAEGAILGSVLAAFCCSFWVFPWFVFKHLQINWMTFFQQHRMPLVATLVGVGVLYGLGTYVPQPLVALGLSLAVAAIGIWVWGLDTELRTTLKQYLKARRIQ